MNARALGLAVAGFLLSYVAIAADPAGGSAAALKAKHAELSGALAKNAFGRPLHMESSEGSDQVKGELYAVLDHPIAKVGDALARPGAWCEILVMPMHLQKCNAGEAGVAMTVASKLGPDAGEGVALKFAFDVAAKSRDYLAVQLTAPEGPAGTRDYRMALEAVPLDANKSFIHVTYSYGYGSMAKLATKTYLSTSGKDKVGFTTGGTRGILERNAMRYLLAVDAYLGSLATPADQRLDRRFKAWIASLARYPKQLSEPQENYAQLKREQMGAISKG